MPNPCQRELGPAEFWFRILARRPRATSDDMLGFTELDERLGTASSGVSYSAAVQAAKEYDRDVFQVLGAAIAHEVGHLLLGANAHTHLGVMCPYWGRTQFELISISELIFTADQSKRLRHQIIPKSGTATQETKTVDAPGMGRALRFP